MEKSNELSHIDSDGFARMVDVGGKPVTVREAVCAGRVCMHPDTLEAVLQNSGPKGDVIATARIAGIQAAKRTSELIPLCHPLALECIDLSIGAGEDGASLCIEARVRTSARTGVEMEAMTGVAVTALTIYDMIKAIDRRAVIRNIRLIEKSGGASGTFIIEPRNRSA